ncbi:MAG: DUF4838 domain-containing protein [Lentisphaerae bacterium]|jgi:hypothetical protein|nr:DUF4838 domain-containing protein [Lentisphaerota bacterium]MBT4818511.1 DUF4838 domain-containing protein [Lentisphaerota bacterium]MBT5610978.1 DUF4838 domain-containing protein [Lentisphaerota bacterium]MBT7059916.1 DUF4838 domain-containing protein [Lentisphaerota bacterium]MBT7848074.1 DUF4838 domain-containing protein [Lentisphaerota bacterium]
MKRVPVPRFRLLKASALLCIAFMGHAYAAGRADYALGKGSVTLATGGVPQCVIVVPQDAPAPVRFAGQELKEHLDAMTGGSFPIVPDMPPRGASIVLGRLPGAVRTVSPTRPIARDGYIIGTIGNTIYIVGNDNTTEKSEILFKVKTPFGRRAGRYAMTQQLGAERWDFERGTLYGTYRFLEELGCRWFFAGEKGRVVPQKRDLIVNTFSLHEEPAFILRKVGREMWQWYMVKSSRVNRVLDVEEYEDLNWDGHALRLWMLRIRGSSEWFAFNHRPVRMDLERRYGKPHPEYFALRENGERDLLPQTGRTGHLCYTHPGVIDITKKDIDAYYAGTNAKDLGFSDHRTTLGLHNRGWPASAIYGRSVSLLPHDSFRGCMCPNCLAITHTDKPRPGQHTELVWQFVTKMADWMKTAHPNSFITCLAYSSYSERPENLNALPENIVVGMCPARYARTANDVKEEHYQDLMRMVGEWSGLNERPMLIWLHHLYRHRNERRRGMPMLLTSLYERLFRDLTPHANMMHIEVDSDSLTLEHLNRYVMLRLLYNPTLEAADLVQDYADSYYGPGGTIIGDLLRDIETRCLAAATGSANSIDFWEKHFGEKTVAVYRKQTDRMLALVEGTPHEEHGQVFSRWFLGTMEKGRALYVRDVKSVAESKGSSISIRQLHGEITIDGKLDEDGWARSALLNRFLSNADGKPTAQKTELRLLRAQEHLYFAFTCHDPLTRELPTKKGDVDYIEIFLDPEHDHDSFYQLLIDTEGRVGSWYHEGAGEPADATWESNIDVAVQRHDGRWIMEIRLPRAGLKDGLHRPVGRPWGANFCRTMARPARPEDHFSCWSPLLRGRFAQPDLFAHIFFVK